ncbi:MAG: hypothetical protein OXN27_25335 [Candidatus Poribacteria bacterium]|nr:hypothetical protein [Candidatus Poribacteria bacterium]
MQHGASGEDFTSGDAKPKGGGTDDFICKYRVRKKDQGSQFWIRIGRWSVDLEWNKMQDHYVHKTRLRLGEPEPEEKEEPEQPAEESEPTVTDDTEKEPEPTQPADTTPPTVVSITHYNDRTGEIIADGASAPAGITVNTEVVFSEPVKPKITYATNNGKERVYTISPRGGVHWRGLCKPVDKNETTWLCKQNAFGSLFSVTVTTDTTDLAGNPLTEPVTTEVPLTSTVVTPKPTVPQMPKETPASVTTPIDSALLPTLPGGSPFVGRVHTIDIHAGTDKYRIPPPTAEATVTITSGLRTGEQAITDQDGYYRFPNAGNEMYLRVERADLEPKEVIVYRNRPTILQYPKGVMIERSFDPEKTPGTVLMGQRWPDAIRFILEKEPLPNNLLYVKGDGTRYAGFYHPTQKIVILLNHVKEWNRNDTLAHELAHTRQHAVAAIQGIARWEDTPEAIAYEAARKKDWEEIGKIFYGDHFTHLIESAAEFCLAYWDETEQDVTDIAIRSQTGEESTLQAEAPNRFKWAQEWLSKQYTR